MEFDEALPTRLGSNLLLPNRYRIIQLIGHSSDSRTFLAVDTQHQLAQDRANCVIKQILLQNSSIQTIERLKQQATALQQLNIHPQVPDMWDCGQVSQPDDLPSFYIAQEFITGDRLQILAEREGSFRESQIWHLLQSLLPILHFCHTHQVIHGDIKPVNIIQPEGANAEFVLVGFGVSEQFPATNFSTTNTSIYRGSAEYTAPEQIQGKITFASDLYGLGVTCLYLLTGISPFHLYDPVSKRWVWRQYLDYELGDRLGYILDKLVQVDLSARFNNASDALLAIGGDPDKITLVAKPIGINWQCIATIPQQSPTGKSINAIAISTEQQIFASGDDNGIIKIWSLAGEEVDKQSIGQIIGHTQAVRCLAINPSRSCIASGSDDCTIKLWLLDLKETSQNIATEICTFSSHTHAVKSLAFSSNYQFLASGSSDKTVKLWDLDRFTEISSIPAHRLQVTAVAFSPDQQLLASASCDRTIRLWRLNSLLSNELPSLQHVLIDHHWAVLAIAFSPDSQILASGSDDRTIKLWDTRKGLLLRTITGYSWSVTSLAFSPDGEILIGASCDKTIKLWRVKTGEEIAKLSGHTDSINTVAINATGDLIVSGSKDGNIKLWQQSILELIY